MRPDERFRRVEELFERALGRPAEERDAFLDGACDDSDVRAEVRRLLRAEPRSADLIERLDLLGRGRAPSLAGSMLGPWRIVERIAEGGMGVVHRAVRDDGLFDQEVAVKVLRLEVATDEAVERFELERRLLARLEHPNIARLLDGGTTPGGTPYLVMEYVRGEPIDAHCARAGLGLEARLRLVASIARAVHFAHKSLVVHRDIKPSNVLVDAHGVPKLLDFGIARLLDEEEGGLATQTGARAFTPRYASPEQLRGEPLTTATDVFSLGILLYELLTGRSPWRQGRSFGEWMRNVLEEEPTRPSTAVARVEDGADPQSPAGFASELRSTPARLRRRLRGDLDRVVLMALRQEPERRYTSAEQLAEDLERFLAGKPVRAQRDTLLYRASRFARRNRLAVASMLLVLVSLCALTVVSWRGRVRAEAAAEHARIEADSFRTMSDFLSDTFLRAGVREEERERVLRSVEVQVAQIRRQHADAPHLRANLVDALGRVYAQLGRFDEAEELIREAAQVRVETFGRGSLEHALSLSSRGTLAWRRGDYPSAVEALGEALELHRDLPPGVHTDVAAAANDLAVALRHVGRTEESRALHREALDLRRRAHGERSLPVAESANNLSQVLLDLERVEEAAALARLAADVRREVLGPAHPLTLQSLVSAAGAQWKGGRLDEVERLLSDAEAGFRELGDSGLEGLSHVLSNLAALHLSREEVDAAARATEESLELVRARLGPDHPQVAVVLVRQALVLARQGRADEARAAWEEVLRIRRAAYPSGHEKLVDALVHYANFMIEEGRCDRAEPLLQEALDVARALGPHAEDGIASAELSLGECRRRAGDVAGASALRARALERFLRLGGEGSAGAKRARDALARLG